MIVEKATIKRIYQTDCTVGVFNFGDFRCFTLELPYRGNIRNISAIPAGLYHCNKMTSPTLGACVSINGALNRTLIRIHKGNFTHQIQGCILVGKTLRDLDGDGVPDVSHSADTLALLLRRVPDKFLLHIE